VSAFPRGAAGLAAVAAALTVALGLVPAAGAAPGLQIGMYEEAQTLFGNPDATFPILGRLGVKVLRVNLYWNRVAPFEPARPANPADLSYNWAVYDRTAFYAQQFGIQLVFSIYGTPGWANGGKGPRYAPKKMTALRSFALAAARRYGGSYAGADGRTIPLVDKWMAWNEPNQPTFLMPQWVKNAKGRYVPESAQIYARMCNAIMKGVHAAGREVRKKETVACGVTSPRGNNIARGARPSVSPLVFLRAMAAAGAEFDVYAHHPYPSSRLETPTSKPAGRTAVTLGNLDALVSELNRLYGRKMRIWITEYGYQTNPPDKLFGVSWADQAKYMRQAFAIARANPRVDMMLWFLLKDETDVGGWQSGLMTAKGKFKPSFATYRKIAHASS
jgi:hypothetical protein